MAGTRDCSADDRPDKENMCANSKTCSAIERLCSSATWKFASDISKLAEQMATHAADREGRLLGEIAMLQQKLCVYTGAVYGLEQKLHQSEARVAKLEKQLQEQQLNWCRYEHGRDFLGDNAIVLYLEESGEKERQRLQSSSCPVFGWPPGSPRNATAISDDMSVWQGPRRLRFSTCISEITELESPLPMQSEPEVLGESGPSAGKLNDEARIDTDSSQNAERNGQICLDPAARNHGESQTAIAEANRELPPLCNVAEALTSIEVVQITSLAPSSETVPLPQQAAYPPVAHFQVGASVDVLRTDGAWSFGKVSEIQGRILVVALEAGKLMKNIDLDSVPSHLVGSIIRIRNMP